MATTATQALRVLDIRGCSVRLKAGRLTAKMHVGGPIPEDLACVIRNNKTKLMAHLEVQERLAITTTNALSLDDADFESWRLEVLAAPESDPEKGHDTEALLQALAAKRVADMAQEVAA